MMYKVHRSRPAPERSPAGGEMVLRSRRPGRRARGTDASPSTMTEIARGTNAPARDAVAAPPTTVIRKVSCVHGEAAPRNLELEAHGVHVVPPGLLLVRVDVEGRVVGRRVDAYTST